MGQCYTVTAHFKFGDVGAFCESVLNSISDWQKKGARFSGIEKLDLSKAWDCFLAVAPDIYSKPGEEETQDNMVVDWDADFDTCYAWESVLQDVLKKALTTLRDGSWVRIYPDDGWVMYRKTRGEITTSWHDCPT